MARLGGDEFAIVLPASGDAAGARAVLQRCLAEIERPIAIVGGHRVTISASIGVVLALGTCDTAAVMRGADEAMYAAKRAGKGRLHFGVAAGPAGGSPRGSSAPAPAPAARALWVA